MKDACNTDVWVGWVGWLGWTGLGQVAGWERRRGELLVNTRGWESRQSDHSTGASGVLANKHGWDTRQSDIFPNPFPPQVKGSPLCQ